MHNPKLFWEKWNKFNEIDTNSKKADIDGEEWQKHFSNLHNDKSGLSMEIPKCDIISSGSISNEPFTKKEFKNVTSKLKTNIAVGTDAICNETIKNSPKIVQNVIHKFGNLCLHHSLVLRAWSMGLITPIFKDGCIDNPDNYRGICISPALLKVIYLLLQIRIQEYCDIFNLINKNQTGFKSNHRCADHLLTLKAVVKKYVTIGEKNLFACFIDFNKICI